LARAQQELEKSRGQGPRRKSAKQIEGAVRKRSER
jgi:hypothetical protein